MAKFRNKPVEIEAVQYWPGKTCQEVAEFTGIPHAEGDCYDDAEWGIPTLEGLVWVRPGDWIIRDVKGDFYPCKSDIFGATYEPMEGE